MIVLMDDKEIFKGFSNKIIYKGDPITIAKLYLIKTRKVRNEYELYSYLYIDEIDSFEKVKKVKSYDVKDLIPLDILENDIKLYFCEILQELDIQVDWGGERSDQITEVCFNGRRTPAAFMFKGRGTRGTLTIDKCGKNGDQLLRLVQEPAIIFFVQHVDAIASEVITQFRLNVEYFARLRKEKLYYCHIDGTDTARLFLSYNKI
jgi:hypothetical protein